MKINCNRWRHKYETPHISIIINNSDIFLKHDIGIYFVIWNFHWWINFPIKNKKYET